MRYLITVLLLIFSLSVLATDKNCLLLKYEKYTVEQELWQKKLMGIVTTNNPELKEVASLYLNDQLLLIKKRSIAVTLLLDKSPEKLKSDQTVNRWLQLEASDDIELAKQSPVYSQLLEDYRVNQNREPHKNGDKLREIMRTEIVPSKDFKMLYSNFSDKVLAINNTVCSVI